VWCSFALTASASTSTGACWRRASMSIANIGTEGRSRSAGGRFETAEEPFLSADVAR
jgi:hypothetical protein